MGDRELLYLGVDVESGLTTGVTDGNLDSFHSVKFDAPSHERLSPWVTASVLRIFLHCFATEIPAAKVKTTMRPNDEKDQKQGVRIPKQPRIEQSEELTQEVFHEHENDGNSKKHRGNLFGGFKYEKGEKR